MVNILDLAALPHKSGAQCGDFPELTTLLREHLAIMARRGFVQLYVVHELCATLCGALSWIRNTLLSHLSPDHLILGLFQCTLHEATLEEYCSHIDSSWDL